MPNYQNTFIILIIILTALVGIIIGVTTVIGMRIGEKSEKKEEKATQAIEESIVNLVAIGDIICNTPNLNAAYDKESKTYDFSSVFINIEEYIKEADIAIGNLETTFAGEERGYTGNTTFNSPDTLGTALKEIGIDILSTANEHCLDKGYDGLERTLNKLDEIGIEHIGTSRSEQEQNKVCIKEINDIKIAFIAFSYGTNGIPVPGGKEFSVNLIEEDTVLNQIRFAKDQNADLICASLHWGEEFSKVQNEDQEQLADYLFNHGVDIIIGNHPHVVEPMKKKTITLVDGTTKDGFVIYSLGNFMSGQNIEGTKSSAILNLQVKKSEEDGKISINDIDYVPVYCMENEEENGIRYEIIDIREALREYESGDNKKISKELYEILKLELRNVESTLGQVS